MKTGTINHLKFKRLKKLLSRPTFQVAGILESLWQVAAECAFAGNIGKFSNVELADAIEFDGDADSLIASLVEAGWLDADSLDATGVPCRLVVHDWAAHAPDFVKKRILRERASVSNSTARQVSPPARETSSKADSTRNKKAAEPVEVPSILAADSTFVVAWGDWLAYRKTSRKATNEATQAAMLKGLAEIGPTLAVECIRLSIRSGWVGLFPERFKGGGDGSPVVRSTTPRVGSGQRFKG